MILVFLDIFLQHLQPAIAKPAEWPCRLGVIFILKGRVEGTGSGHCLNLALTREFTKHFNFLKLRQGTGTCSYSSAVGLRMDLISLIFKSWVYSYMRKVSYGHFVLAFELCRTVVLFVKGTDCCALVIKLEG